MSKPAAREDLGRVGDKHELGLRVQEAADHPGGECTRGPRPTCRLRSVPRPSRPSRPPRSASAGRTTAWVVDALIEQAASADGLTRIAAEGTTPGSRPTPGSDTPKMSLDWLLKSIGQAHHPHLSRQSDGVLPGQTRALPAGITNRVGRSRRTSMTPNILRHAGHLYLWRRWLRPLRVEPQTPSAMVV